jgi:hypothetical protein
MDRARTHVNAAGSNSLLRREIDEATVLKAIPPSWIRARAR